MGCDVYANGDEISCKAGANKVIAAFPDVCLSPPSPPAGPIPVPYPNTSFSKDMQKGSKTVKIKNKEVMLKDQSFYKTSPLGDEAATKGLGQGVITHTTTGKTYFVAWSMDVKFEGKNVDRHSDLTTSNHASPMANEGLVAESQASQKKPPPDAKCPCCDAPIHPNQYDPDTGEPYKPISEEEFYQEGRNFRKYEASPEKAATVKDAVQDGKVVATREELLAKDQNKLAGSEAATKTLEEARKQDPPCPNLHKEQKGCGQYLNKTNPEPKTSDPKVRRTVLGFGDEVRNACLDANPKKPDGTLIKKKNASIVHKTPLSAGGCPTSQDNLIPKDALTDECKAVDDAQSTLQGDRDAARQAETNRGAKTW